MYNYQGQEEEDDEEANQVRVEINRDLINWNQKSSGEETPDRVDTGSNEYL